MIAIRFYCLGCDEIQEVLLPDRRVPKIWQCRKDHYACGVEDSWHFQMNPAWQSSNVVSLAQAIYDERAFNRMPILADALEDAGCTNADVLNHCRKPGEHVRGCWVVDLLLGKQ